MFCQRSFAPAKIKTFAEADSEREIQTFLVALSNNRYGIEKEMNKGGSEDGTEKRFPMLGEIVNKKDKWAYIARILGEGGKTFMEGDIEKCLSNFDLGAKEGVKWLKESHIIYEPRPGIYKLL